MNYCCCKVTQPAGQGTKHNRDVVWDRKPCHVFSMAVSEVGTSVQAEARRYPIPAVSPCCACMAALWMQAVISGEKGTHSQQTGFLRRKYFLAVSGNITQKEQCKPSPKVCRQGSTSEPVSAHGSTMHQGNIINTSQLSFIDNTGRSDKIGYVAKSCICFIQALLEKAISCHEDNCWRYLWQQNQREEKSHKME